MKFWKQFPKSAVIKQLLFALVLFAILIPIALWDSGTQVKISLDSDTVFINSDKYRMSIRYEQIESLELTALEDPGERIHDDFDNDIIRCGIWNNDAWGEHYICVDLDVDQCIIAHLDDGRTFVFSTKNNGATEELFESLQDRLTSADS